MPDLKTVATYTNPLEAEIARGLLESEGIPAFVVDDNIVRINWSMSQAVGGVRLSVPVSFEAAANLILAQQRRGEYEEALEEHLELPPEVCQRCGSRALRPTRAPWSIALLLATFGIVGVIFPLPRNGRRCGSCGNRQEDAR